MNEDTRESFKTAVRMAIIFSIIALHEFGYREWAGRVALWIAVFAIVSMVLMLLEGTLHRFQARMQAEQGEREDSLYYTSSEYRKAWDKTRSKIRSGK